MSVLFSLTVIIYIFYILTVVVDELFVPALDEAAKYLKLPPSVAGATLMAMGTSAPELSTTLFALFLAGANPATGVGTVVGSAIFQILVVIGFAAAIKTSYLNWKPVIRDGVFYAISVLLLIAVVRDNTVTVQESAVLVIAYVVYLLFLWWWTRNVDASKEPDPIEILEQGTEEIDAAKHKTPSKKQRQQMSLWARILKIWDTITWPVDWLIAQIPKPQHNKNVTLPLFIGSLAAIAGSSYLLVVHAEIIASLLGIPPAIIALTILAGGSSIPEMVGSAIVAKQGRGDMAISNAIGSNIFDIQISLGLPLLIFTLQQGTLYNVGGANITSSVLLLFVTLVMVLGLLAVQKFKATRTFGMFLISVYIVYVAAAYTGLL